jgi:hypothetical protein
MPILRLFRELLDLSKTHKRPLGTPNQYLLLCMFTDYIHLIKFVEFSINFHLKTRQESGKQQISLES